MRIIRSCVSILKKHSRSRDGSLVEAALEIREIKCIDKILETAKISEVAPEKLAAKHKAEHKPVKKAEKVEKKEEKAEKPKKETKPAPKKPAAKKKTK